MTPLPLNTLPLRPACRADESAAGYTRRVAHTNGYQNTADLLVAFGLRPGSHLVWANAEKSGGVVMAAPARSVNASTSEDAHILYHHARCCPLCLQHHGYWRQSWEHALVSLCLEHGVLLRDRCHTCQQPLLKSTVNLAQCECGADLRSQSTDAVPEGPVIALAESLLATHTSAVYGFPAELGLLSPADRMQLSVFLGSYRSFPHRAKPRKAAIKTDVDTAMQVLSGAAATLADWPCGISNLVALYIKEDKPARSVRQRLGYLYVSTYKAFGQATFDFLRVAFDDYLLSTWPDLIEHKSRWIANVRNGQRFVSATALAKAVGVPATQLREWVASGQLEGSIKTLLSGRTQVTVKTGQEKHIQTLNEKFNLSAAAAYLGLPDKRVLELLSMRMIPGRPPVAGGEWHIAADELKHFKEKVWMCAKPSSDQQGFLSLDRVLRYRWNTNLQFPALMNALLSGEIDFALPAEATHLDLRQLMISIVSFNHWCGVDAMGLSIPALGKRLRIKQEVAYHLVDRGIIPAEGSGRPGLRVMEPVITAFERDYCFARDIAQRLKTSPKSIIEKLDSHRIRPVAGPTIDGCRQYLYRRGEAEVLVASEAK